MTRNARARQWVVLGLLAAGACGQEPEPEPPAPVTPPPTTGPRRCPVPAPTPASTPASTLAAPDADGRLPVLVRLRPATGVHAAALSRDGVRVPALERAGGRLTRHWAHLGVAAARLTPAEQERLRADPEVLSVEPDRPVHALWQAAAAPQPAPFAAGSPGEYTPHLQLVQAPAVWDADGDGTVDPGAPTGEGVRVCVVDSGIDWRHPELMRAWTDTGKVGKDFVDRDDLPYDQDAKGAWGGGHGTHVAGIIAAQPGNGGVVVPGGSLGPGGMVGAAPGVTLLVARVLNTKGEGSTSDVVAALDWCAEKGAHIVSLSLGSTECSEAEAEAMKRAWDRGMLVVAASGNDGLEDPAAPQPVMYPAGYPEVLAVGAVRLDRTHPTFSQTGAHLSLVAPGVAVPSTYIVGSQAFAQLDVGGLTPAADALEYSAMGEATGPLVDCGKAATSNPCGAGASSGFVALVDRGDVTFANKVRNVQAQGARAVVLVNNAPSEEGEGFTLGEPSDTWPPVVMVAQTERTSLRGKLGSPVRLDIRGADYRESTGTSMATPFVSAVAALVKGTDLSLTPTRLRALLEASALDLGAAGKDPVFGAGLVQAREALRLAAQPPTP